MLDVLDGLALEIRKIDEPLVFSEFFSDGIGFLIKRTIVLRKLARLTKPPARRRP